jgi:alpha-1,6-mannosyltransferase
MAASPGSRFGFREPELAAPERPPSHRSSLIAFAGLGALLLGTAVIVGFAAAGPSMLVEGSRDWARFPGWLAGPLHGRFGSLAVGPAALRYGFSAVMVMMTLAYLAVLRHARALTLRTVAVFALVAGLILLLGPALQMTDMFNYLGYARLEALHGLNPYTHVIASQPHDPVFRLASWVNWTSPYGSLFTILTYPLGRISLPAAYWTLKVATVLASLVFLWLVGRCATLLGHDRRFAVLIVAANPIYLIYTVGEFHNDVFMLVPSMAAVALLLSAHFRAAGVALAAAVAVKLTAVVLLPFLLLGAYRRRASRRLLSGLVLAGGLLAALSLAMFGPTVPNVAGQSRLLTGLSIPNLAGWALGFGGGTPGVLHAMNIVIVVAVAYQLLRRRDWLTGAGWATLALLASLGWLMPWYVVWLLPLAAVADDLRLRAVALAATAFLIVAFLPVTGSLLRRLEINPTAGPVGLAAWDYQRLAQFGPRHRDADARALDDWQSSHCLFDASTCGRGRPQRRA